MSADQDSKEMLTPLVLISMNARPLIPHINISVIGLQTAPIRTVHTTVSVQKGTSLAAGNAPSLQVCDRVEVR